jgi:hypothetical protein
VEQVVMHCVAARVILTLVIFASAHDTNAEELTVTIQIHDYSRVPSGSLSNATAIVTHIYRKIGVRTQWMGVARPAERQRGSERDAMSAPPAAQMTLIILTPKMATRARVAEHVLGYAAVPDHGMGSIAFAIYERVRAAAGRIPANEGELLGFVMAHEIGHLMLPGGLRQDTGPMKNHWHIRDFQRLSLPTLEFSPEQARLIRRTLADASLRD